MSVQYDYFEFRVLNHNAYLLFLLHAKRTGVLRVLGSPREDERFKKKIVLPHNSILWNNCKQGFNVYVSTKAQGMRVVFETINFQNVRRFVRYRFWDNFFERDDELFAIIIKSCYNIQIYTLFCASNLKHSKTTIDWKFFQYLV